MKIELACDKDLNSLPGIFQTLPIAKPHDKVAVVSLLIKPLEIIKIIISMLPQPSTK